MHVKKSNKQSSFTAYSDHEKGGFTSKALPLSCLGTAEDEDPGSRALTSLDDFMQSMDYVKRLAQDRRV